ncbi:transcriptional regulator [Lentzea guizhouensis]|uniref:Transcriptional regulator n=1 Tax=Lentzea guizhouensis TaxID=1586287 RepID=A0A1B2HRG7_9PSEU|nr:transcriptional regulator [Lentzea guizhouensis]ANZ40317.1 transcriptional regulator [Lentzea guizhouensis]
MTVLHALRCVGSTDVGRVAAFTGLGESEVESELIDLAVAGLVTHHKGFGGWQLTEAGKAADAERTAAELDAAGTRTALKEAFEDFLVLNPELLDLCTAWQVRQVDGVMTINDHRDAAYDDRVVRMFADFHERAVVVIGELAAAVPRFGRYETRLGTALARARAGERKYLADTIASFHTVWAELHEDLLATLGIQRWTT